MFAVLASFASASAPAADKDWVGKRVMPKRPNLKPGNARAWLMATCPDESLRDGPRAVEAATRACELSKWKNPNIVDTLAAAHAEAGDFEKAVKYQKQALASDDFDESERANGKARLKLYEAKKPYRQ